MMGKRGEFSFVSFLIALAFVGLIASVIGFTVLNLNAKYNQDNFDDSFLLPYNDTLSEMENLTLSTQGGAESVLNESVDTNAFDVIGQYVRNGVSSLKIMMGSLSIGQGALTAFFSLLPVFSTFKVFVFTALTIIVIIGYIVLRIWLKPK